jgi:multidrug efflux pump subunit AcrA (membrane-fusion protein)
MNEPTQDSHFAGAQRQSDRHRYLHIWVVVLGALVVAAGGYSVWLGSQTRDLRAQFAAAQLDNAALRSKLADTGTQLQTALDSLREDISKAEADTSASLEKAQTTAMKHADVAAAQLAKKTAAEAQQLSEQLNKVRDSATDASNRLDGITSDVGTVKTDVATAKSAIDDTRSDLQRARGDMGVMSGLIATNGKQIQELRDLGDRNIFEFTLKKDGKMAKVGDIQLMLRKVDSGHNRFSVDVLADDKRVEKKDRGINEPVQFYTGKTRQPYEIVVNDVGKNQVTGYLATPKVTLARNGPAGQ